MECEGVVGDTELGEGDRRKWREEGRGTKWRGEGKKERGRVERWSKVEK